MTTVSELVGGLATRASAHPFHPDLRLLSRVLPSGIVFGPRSLRVARRLAAGPIRRAVL